MPVIRPALRALVIGLSFLSPAPSVAQNMSSCSATMTNVAFGSVSLREGVVHSTSGSLTISCAQLISSVGICVRFGTGSGGAASQNLPRYMRRADGDPLAYDMRIADTGRSGYHLQVTSWLGMKKTIPVQADITSRGAVTGTGDYSSEFSASSGATIEYPVSSCAETGPTVKLIPSFTVSASVTSLCELEGAALDFERIDPATRGHIDGATQLGVRCTAATPYAIRLGPGGGAGASGPTDRRMTGLGGQLRYGLYQNAARSIPWGDDPGNDLHATGTAATQLTTVHGRIFGGQALHAGQYADSVLVTIEY